MVLFNHATREMTAKIVYYGPGLCGKTTNLMVIFDKLDPSQKGKMLSLATKTDRTLFFDLLPVDIGKVANFNLKIQLYTVPGQVFYNETRKLVLKGADSIVFVADSQPAMVEANRESFANLLENMQENNLDPNDTPIVIQYNKRDIPGVLPVEELQEKLAFDGYPFAEASALKGEGVMETFKLVSKITAKHLMARFKTGKSEPVRKTAPAAKKAAKVAAAEPEPAPVAAPFPESIPFPESPMDSGYEKMEEVSLEDLLSEGRERPATLSGSIPVPVSALSAAEGPLDDVEELGTDALLPEPEPVAVAVLDEPVPVAAPAALAGENRLAILEKQVAALESQIEIMRAQHRAALEDLVRDLSDLVSRIRSQF
jgi:signal recognition particle receptor subunit beta